MEPSSDEGNTDVRLSAALQTRHGLCMFASAVTMPECVGGCLSR